MQSDVIPALALSASQAPQPEVSALLLRALVEVVRRHGVSAKCLLGREHDILAVEPVERRYSRAAFQSLLARAIALTEESALGLSCGLHASGSSFGVMAPLVAHAGSLRRALELVIRFQPLLASDLNVTLSENDEIAQLCCDVAPASAEHGSFMELVMAGLARTLRALGCAPEDVRAVSFRHARPQHHHTYAMAFDGEVRFEQSVDGITFAAAALDRPNLHRYGELHMSLLAEAERNLQLLWRPPTFTEQVLARMTSGTSAELPEMTSIAKCLGVSQRTLRRRLEAEGTSYRQLAQTALHRMACTMLRNPSNTLQGIAQSLGFANATGFHRAFRRWCALTPSEYRSGIFELTAHESVPRDTRSCIVQKGQIVDSVFEQQS